MLSKLKTLFTKQKEREWLTKPRHEIKLAFVHKGVEYFMFQNEQNIVSERAFSAIDVYEELNQRITREYLEGYFAAVLAATNAGDLVKVANLTSNAMQRLAHITNVEILYKLASVLYFTKEENHYTYDREYNEKKIAKWKEDKDIDAFFFEFAHGKLSALFRWIYNEYADLYNGAKQRANETFTVSFVHIIRERERQRFEDKAQRAGGKLEEMERYACMTIKEHHDYLRAMKKIDAKAKKK